MTVRELIEFLKECDQDRKVVIDGYEGGLKELNQAILTDIFLDYHLGMRYYGPHELVDSTWRLEDDGRYQKEKAVYFPR